MKRKQRIIRTFLPVLAGFLALYLALMGIATFLIKGTFMERFETHFNTIFNEMEENIRNKEAKEEWLANGYLETAAHNYDPMLSYRAGTVSAYFQYSFALFDEEKKLLSQSKMEFVKHNS